MSRAAVAGALIGVAVGLILAAPADSPANLLAFALGAAGGWMRGVDA